MIGERWQGLIPSAREPYLSRAKAAKKKFLEEHGEVKSNRKRKSPSTGVRTAATPKKSYIEDEDEEEEVAKEDEQVAAKGEEAGAAGEGEDE